MQNKIILGDCLEVMKKMPAESIALIYLDPPFFSNRNYEIIWGDAGEIRSFEDRWSGGIDQYINWLYDRVKEMHRLLKPTGSIYLHCDWHADAYIRVMILDKEFGYENFRGHIIWKRTNAHNDAKKKLAVLTDTIWYYSKSNNFSFNPIYSELTEKYSCNFYKYDDMDGKGKYSLGDLTNTRPGGYNYEYKGYLPNANGWRCPFETMQKWDADNKIYFPKSQHQRLRIKRYLSETKGQLIGNDWIDIQNVQGTSIEKIGYPTQKPLALLERIIKASSNEGDVVLDPFMGGGTTMLMANNLQRNFIGIDQSIAALDVTDKRLQANGIFTNYEIEKHYFAEEDLRAMDPFEFETWIVGKFGGTPNEKQRGDHGSDGMKDDVPIQVKSWKNKIGRVEIQKFFSVCHAGRKFKEKQENGLPVGYFIAFDFAKEAVQEMARLKNEDGILIERVLVSEIVDVAKRPVVRIDCSKTLDGKYEFRAVSDSVIINYSWDFNYPIPAHKFPQEVGKFNPSVLYDKNGVRVHNFAEGGVHNVAVRVVDDKYLENMAVYSFGE
ncbi:MAG: restriction endonuclease [Ignavibacteria bacterium]|jgi:DNA modification methylase|nr:restriction endonuclease [Ignavibacteria bacterium]